MSCKKSPMLSVLLLLLAAPAFAQGTENPESPIEQQPAPVTADTATTGDAPQAADASVPQMPAVPASDGTEQVDSSSESAASANAVSPEPAAPVETIPLAAPANAASTDERAPVKADTTKLEDIIVTATKRGQSVREIPMSINAITGEKLEAMGSRKLKDFIQMVPGINMQDEVAGYQRKISVRGVGPDNHSSQTVGVLIGDMAISDPLGPYTQIDPDPWDMSTVEILKGPQGTTFGATSLAGIIRYVPTTPELQQWGGKAFADRVSVANGGIGPAFGGALNVPLGDTLALRVSGTWQHAPGVIDIDNPSRHEKDADDTYARSGRIMGLWQPTDRATINALYMQAQKQGNELNYVTNQDGVYARDDAPSASPYKNGYKIGTLDARYAFDWATLVSLSGYQSKFNYNDIETSEFLRPLAQAGLSVLKSHRTVDNDGFIQELRLVSPDGGPWTWLAGGFYSSFTAHVVGSTYIPGTTTLGDLLNFLPLPIASSLFTEYGLTPEKTGYDPIKASERSLFGEITRTLWGDWSATLGGRFYQTELAGATVEQAGDIITVNDKGFSPKFSLSYRPDKNLMIYANASRGFQYGGFNVPVTLPVPRTYKSSTLWNYELGVRTDWFDRTLRADLTAFYLDWKDPQISQPDQLKTSTYITNVGGAHSKGLETTLRYLTPLPGLAIEVAASYILAKTSKPFTDDMGNLVPAGADMPNSPRVQATTTLSYSRTFGEWLSNLAVMGTYQGTAWNDIEHDYSVGGYYLLNLNAGVSRSDLPLSPSLTVTLNNVLNQNSITYIVPGQPAIAALPELSDHITPRATVNTQPRSLRLNLAVQF